MLVRDGLTDNWDCETAVIMIKRSSTVVSVPSYGSAQTLLNAWRTWTDVIAFFWKCAWGCSPAVCCFHIPQTLTRTCELPGTSTAHCRTPPSPVFHLYCLSLYLRPFLHPSLQSVEEWSDRCGKPWPPECNPDPCLAHSCMSTHCCITQLCVCVYK